MKRFQYKRIQRTGNGGAWTKLTVLQEADFAAAHGDAPAVTEDTPDGECKTIRRLPEYQVDALCALSDSDGNGNGRVVQTPIFLPLAGRPPGDGE